MEAENQTNGKNGSGALAKLLNQLNIPTLVVILLTGGGNLFQGSQISGEVTREREQAIKQIKDLHDKIDEFEERQAKSLNNQKDLLESSHIILKSQEQTLEIVRRTQKRFMASQGLKEDLPAPDF